MPADSLRSADAIGKRTWFEIVGALDPIEFEGESFFRFPEELARRVLDRFTDPGDLVLDPFCGFGTTLVVAEALGRRAVGIEKDGERYAFASRRVHEPNRVIHASALELNTFDLPPCDLVFTSPPFSSMREWDDEGFARCWGDFEAVFSDISAILKPAGHLVIDISNVREADSELVRPVAFDAGMRLSKRYVFLGEIVRCNTGPESAGPGFDHSFLMVFRPGSAR